MKSYSHATDLRRAISLLESGRIAEAEAIAQLALKQDRKNALVHALLGKIADTKGLLDAAAKHYEKSIRLDLKQVMTHIALGQLRTNQGRYKEAIASIERALRLNPDNPNAIAALADAHDKGGEPERALELLQASLQNASETPQMAVVFATVKMNMGDHEAGIQMARKHLVSQELGANARQLLGFTLGRSLEAIGHYDESFKAYQDANQALPSDFNPDAFTRSIDDLITVFSKSRLSTLSRSRQTTELPVFIAGMPRSGTTLVERIINTHPEARGAGEIIFLQRLISDMPLAIQSDQPYPQCVLDMDENDADRMAKDYLNNLRLFTRGVRRVTDKNLLNWRYLGLISCLFPQARVIHCYRNPLDTCFSCFTSSLFNLTCPWASDLKWIGMVHGEYWRLMDHWKSVLEIQILDVSYEALIRDQEIQSKRLLEFLGLTWDDRCLQFHKNKKGAQNPGIAPTLSYDQVRRPVYSSSIGRAQRFQAHLRPLVDALNTGTSR